MNGYEEYLENLLDLKEKEITYLKSQVDAYKIFIEKELKCRIKETVDSSIELDKKGIHEIFYKVIDIPQTRYIVKTEQKFDL